MSQRIDIGHNHTMKFFSWAPDDLPANRERFGVPLPNVPRAGLTVSHLDKGGNECMSGIWFDLPELKVMDERHRWKVESWEPLTISPSLLCMRCGDHGFIRSGLWVPA